MNKRIYYKERFLEFAATEPQSTQNQSLEIISLNPGSEKKMSWIVDRFLGASNRKNFLIAGADFRKSVAQIREICHYIEAGGGLIENDNRFLFIFRHNKWDLPKGKREKKESAEQCAVRECEEECGVRGLSIARKLPATWHLYEYKNGYAIKKTHWFHMTTAYGGPLTPQEEESITEARWMTRDEIRSVAMENTYRTIAGVVRHALGI